MTIEDTKLEDEAGGVNIFEEFETDVDAEENGKWFDDVRGEGSGLSIKVRAFTSQAARTHMQKLLQANRKHVVKGKLPEDIDRRLLIEHLATSVLLGWKGVNGRDGKPLKYTKETAIEVLTRLPKFRELVLIISQNMDNFRTETKEEIAGN